jgi:fermentation-respiration switch protein FrsA (DUF1100 family)
VVGALLGVPALVIGLLWTFQRKIIYLPDRSVPPAASTLVPGADDVTLHTSDGLALTAWHVPAPDVSCPVTVLIASGNGGNRAGRAGLMTALASRGYGVLLLEYRGYGGNPGSPTEDGLAADALAAREFLVAHGVDDAHLIHFGESLGSAVVTRLAASYPPAGTVLRSPFTELTDAAAVHYPLLPVRWLLKDRFPVASLVAEQHQPIEVVLGDADSVIPPALSQGVIAAAGGPAHLTVVPGADHNDPILAAGPAVLDAVDRLAARIDCRSSPG